MKQVIVTLLSKLLNKEKELIEHLLGTPPDLSLGDYAFPCFFLAKELKQDPTTIAKELKSKISKNLPQEIMKIETRGPYLNFFLNKNQFAEETLKKVLKEKEQYGSRTKAIKNNKILIEHTSTNPNAPPHVGRARNAFIGDALARLLKFRKYHVETHFYVNDVSKQIAMLAFICTGNEKFHDLLQKYITISKRVEEEAELEKKILKLLEKFEKSDKTTQEKFKKVVSIAIEGQKKTLEEAGVNFDYFDYESSFIEETKSILKRLKETGKLFADEHGRSVLNQEGMGFEQSMKSPVLVVTRSDGTGLYILRDLAYTLYKMRKADRNILVLGEDQKLYFQQLKAALQLLGEQAPEVVHYSFVLIETSEGVGKMSTRKGDIVLLEDFMRDAEAKAKIEVKERETKGDPKKIAIAAVKFALLKNDPKRNIIFNLNHALSFEGETGPYLLYSYARASSILRKARAMKMQAAKEKKEQKKGALHLEEKENQLITKIAQFPEIIAKTEEILDVSLIANYAFQLAQAFNEFYHSCPVLGSEQEEFRTQLVESFRYTIKNSLQILGIETLEEM